jgi:hypothetical protein
VLALVSFVRLARARTDGEWRWRWERRADRFHLGREKS